MKSHYFRPLLFAAKNKNSHKSTFNSRVSFIKLPKDRNILSFTKVQLSDVNFKKRQKTLMFEIVFLILFIFFSFWSWKNSTVEWEKVQFWYYPRKKFSQTFWCQRASARQNCSNCIYNSYSLHYQGKPKSTSLHYIVMILVK